MVATRALGVASAVRGDLPVARAHLERAVELGDGAGLAERSGEARGALAYLLTLGGETSRALALIDEATPAMRGVPAARLMMQRALVLSEIGRYGDSTMAFADSLDALEDAGGDELVEADIRTNRSILFTLLRDWRSAERISIWPRSCTRPWATSAAPLWWRTIEA